MENLYGIGNIDGLDRLVKQANEMKSLFKRMNISTSQLQKNAEMLRQSRIDFIPPDVEKLATLTRKMNLPNSQIFNQVRELSRIASHHQWPMGHVLSPTKHIVNQTKTFEDNESDDSSVDLASRITNPREKLISEVEQNVSKHDVTDDEYKVSLNRDLGLTDDYVYNDYLYFKNQEQFQIQIWNTVWNIFIYKLVPAMSVIVLTDDFIKLVHGFIISILRIFHLI